jgi:hypothetical protein
VNRRFVVVLVASTIARSSALRAQGQATVGYVPPNGFVPDSATAVRIAVAVWTPIYGAEQLAHERPFRATLRSGIWHVQGSLPKPRGRLVAVGGVAEIEIAKRDGRIVRVSHGR